MRYFTADLHLNHPFVAAIRGFWKYGKQPNLKTSDEINAFRNTVGEQAFLDYVDVKRHDYTIIKRINEVCGKNDELFVAGDLSSNATASKLAALKQLNALHVPRSRCHLILGNHDGFRLNDSDANKLALEIFGTISDIRFLTLENQQSAIITHMPRKQYIENPSRNERLYSHYVPNKIVHLYGHTHSKVLFEFRDGKSINIGLDAWKLRPVSEKQILDLLKKLPHIL